MATVFKRPSSRFWNACYRDREGRLKRPSTKLTDKAAALRLATEWEKVERMAKEGQAGTAQFHAVVSQISREVIGESLPSPSVQAYLHDYLDHVRRRSAPATVERYTHTVALFLANLGKTASQPIRSVSPVLVERFLDSRIQGGVAPKTAIVDIKTLSSAFKRAEKLGYIDKNPVSAVTLPKATSTEREIFTMEEVEQLVAATPNLDWQTVILLGFYLGARLGDCVAMTWDNVDTTKGLIHYIQQKTKKRVVVPLHARLVQHLHHLSATNVDGPLCPTLFAKTSGGKHGLSEGFKRVVKRAGLDLMVVQGQGTRQFARRTFHSLRHSFSSALANVGVSAEVRMQLTGHRSSEIHSKYTHMSTVPLKQAIDALRPANPTRTAT
jgi:integrase